MWLEETNNEKNEMKEETNGEGKKIIRNVVKEQWVMKKWSKKNIAKEQTW